MRRQGTGVLHDDGGRGRLGREGRPLWRGQSVQGLKDGQHSPPSHQGQSRAAGREQVAGPCGEWGLAFSGNPREACVAWCVGGGKGRAGWRAPCRPWWGGMRFLLAKGGSLRGPSPEMSSFLFLVRETPFQSPWEQGWPTEVRLF